MEVKENLVNFLNVSAGFVTRMAYTCWLVEVVVDLVYPKENSDQPLRFAYMAHSELASVAFLVGYPEMG